MKILLDECLPVDFRHSFPNHEVHTAQWAGLKGKDNGELLRAAAVEGYDLLLSVDQDIFRQQPGGSRHVALILIRARTNQLEDLLPLVGAISEALDLIKPGEIHRIPAPV